MWYDCDIHILLINILTEMSRALQSWQDSTVIDVPQNEYILLRQDIEPLIIVITNIE